MQEYFYHYTTESRLKDILREGLVSRRSLDTHWYKGFPPVAEKPAIWGFIAPAPAEWLARGRERNVFRKLLRHISGHGESGKPDDLVLLRVRAAPGDDLWLGDYSHISDKGEAIHNPSTYRSAINKYIRSMTRLRDEFAAAAIKLLEVLCFNPIPPQHIEVVARIPAAEIRSYITEISKAAAPA